MSNNQLASLLLVELNRLLKLLKTLERAGDDEQREIAMRSGRVSALARTLGLNLPLAKLSSVVLPFGPLRIPLEWSTGGPYVQDENYEPEWWAEMRSLVAAAETLAKLESELEKKLTNGRRRTGAPDTTKDIAKFANTRHQRKMTWEGIFFRLEMQTFGRFEGEQRSQQRQRANPQRLAATLWGQKENQDLSPVKPGCEFRQR